MAAAAAKNEKDVNDLSEEKQNEKDGSGSSKKRKAEVQEEEKWETKGNSMHKALKKVLKGQKEGMPVKKLQTVVVGVMLENADNTMTKKELKKEFKTQFRATSGVEVKGDCAILSRYC